MSLFYRQEPGSLFESVDFSVIYSGFANNYAEWKGNSVSPSYSRIYYMFGGDGYVYAGGTTTLLLPGRCYLLPAGLSVSFSCKTSITQLFFHILLRDASGTDLFSSCRSIVEQPAPEAEELLTLYRSSGPEAALLLRSRLFACAVSLLQKSGMPDWKPYSGLVQGAAAYVQGHLSASLTIREIAASLLVSDSLLSKRFRQEMGIPIGKYIDKAVLAKAEQLLVCTELSMKEISDQLGFCDQFYFSRRFSEKFGVSPIVYRRSQPI